MSMSAVKAMACILWKSTMPIIRFLFALAVVLIVVNIFDYLDRLF